MIQFRPVTEADYTNICDLVTDEEEMFRVYPAGSFPFTVDQVECLAQARKELTVAELDSTIIGFSNLYNYEAEERAFIGNVVIDRQQRGKGYGKEIVSYMLDTAFGKHQLQEIHISVFSHNIPALRLYTGFGFEPYRIEDRKDYAGRKVALLHLKLDKENSKQRQ